MGGREPDPRDTDDKGEKIIAPCGKCTDTLASWMAPESAVYVYPKNNGNMLLKINDSAETLADVKGNEVWKTTIGHLNRFRHIALTSSQAQAQQDALEGLVHELLSPAPPVSDEVIAREASNKRDRIRSIAELDIASTHAGSSTVAVNAYMHEQLVEVLRARMKGDEVALTADAVRAWLTSDRIDSIAIVVVQHEDGTYAAGAKAQTKTKADRASSSSQLSSINSIDSIVTRGEHPVKQSWSMNFSVEDIVNGATTTPSKDGIERLIKSMNGSALAKPFTHFTFNDGKVTGKALDDLTFTFSVKDLSPGGFKGLSWRDRSQGEGAGCGHAH